MTVYIVLGDVPNGKTEILDVCATPKLADEALVSALDEGSKYTCVRCEVWEVHQ